MNLKKLNILNIIFYNNYIAYYTNNNNLSKVNEGNIKIGEFINNQNFFDINKIIENIKKQNNEKLENVIVKLIIDSSFLTLFQSNNIQILLPKIKKIFISFLGEKNIKKTVIFSSKMYDFENIEVTNKLKNLKFKFHDLKTIFFNLKNKFLTTCNIKNSEIYLLSIKNTFLNGNIKNNKLKQLNINNSLLGKKICLNIKKINELNIENSSLINFNNLKNTNIKILSLKNLKNEKQKNKINKLYIKNLEYLKLVENNLDNIDIKLVNTTRIIFISNKFNNIEIKYNENFKNLIKIEMGSLNIFNNLNVDIKKFDKNVEILIKKVLIKNKLTINNVNTDDNKLSYFYIAHSNIDTLYIKNFSIVRQINSFSKTLFLSGVEIFYYEYKKFLMQHKNKKNFNLYPFLKLYNVKKIVFSIDENIHGFIKNFKNKILKNTNLEIYFRNENYQKEILSFITTIYDKNLKLKNIYVNVEFLEKNLELKFLNDKTISFNKLLYKNKIKQLLLEFLPYFYKLKIDVPDFIKNIKSYKIRKNKNDLKIFSI